jgi:hypothetical protein
MKRYAAPIAVGALLLVSLGQLDASQPTPIHSVPPSAFYPVVLPSVDPSIAPVVDTVPGLGRPGYQRVSVLQPEATARVVPKAASYQATGHSISGLASYYCRAGVSPCVKGYPDTRGFDAYAAAGPALRIAMGGGAAVTAPDPWRGKVVRVCGDFCVRVKLIDWCQCHWRTSIEKLIDLYYDPFRRTGGGKVVVSW